MRMSLLFFTMPSYWLMIWLLLAGPSSTQCTIYNNYDKRLQCSVFDRHHPIWWTYRNHKKPQDPHLVALAYDFAYQTQVMSETFDGFVKTLRTTHCVNRDNNCGSTDAHRSTERRSPKLTRDMYLVSVESMGITYISANIGSNLSNLFWPKKFEHKLHLISHKLQWLITSPCQTIHMQ